MDHKKLDDCVAKMDGLTKRMDAVGKGSARYPNGLKKGSAKSGGEAPMTNKTGALSRIGGK